MLAISVTASIFILDYLIMSNMSISPASLRIKIAGSSCEEQSYSGPCPGDPGSWGPGWGWGTCVLR